MQCLSLTPIWTHHTTVEEVEDPSSYQDLTIDTGTADDIPEIEFENLTIDELCSNDVLNRKPGMRC